MRVRFQKTEGSEPPGVGVGWGGVGAQAENLQFKMLPKAQKASGTDPMLLVENSTPDLMWQITIKTQEEH